MARPVRFAAFTALLALLVAGCGGSKKSSSGGNEGQRATIAGVSANDHGSKEVGGKTEIELDDYYFEPTVLKGKPGSRVMLELKNESGTEHNFTVDAQNVDQDVEAGKSATVTVTIPQSGEISFYCKYHESMGMAGALSASG
jgi:plastocyanin